MFSMGHMGWAKGFESRSDRMTVMGFIPRLNEVQAERRLNHPRPGHEFKRRSATLNLCGLIRGLKAHGHRHAIAPRCLNLWLSGSTGDFKSTAIVIGSLRDWPY